MVFVKKYLFVIVLSVGSCFLILNFAQADSYGTGKTASYAQLPKTVAGADSVESLVGQIVKVALSLIGIVFFLLIFYAGFNWMTAQGNGEKIEKSKSTIISALIGIIVVVAAYGITNFIFENLNVNSNTGADAACNAQSGVCGTPGACDTTAGFRIVNGLCPGDNTNVCCVPN